MIQVVLCPHCGSDDVGTDELIEATATILGYDPESKQFEWTGYTDVCYDTSTTNLTTTGNPIMFCRGCCEHFAFNLETGEAMESFQSA